ncbi:hypothetical protein ASG30_16685 [Ramlibacter sp. Leaf400]|nr:hypothetical protein ASG30_16685 [Ramlibacter sp. Leaf400]
MWQWPYSAFGDNKPRGALVRTLPRGNEPAQLIATEPIEFGLRFPGQQEDAEAGLSDNLFRWHHSKGGRQLQKLDLGEMLTVAYVKSGTDNWATVVGEPVMIGIHGAEL